MAFSLSNLLNPAPASGNATPLETEQYETEQNLTSLPVDVFAPELFQSGEDVVLEQQRLAAMAMDAASALEANTARDNMQSVEVGTITSQFKQELHDEPQNFDASVYPDEGLSGHGNEGLSEHQVRQTSSQPPRPQKKPSEGSKKKKRQDSQEDMGDKAPKSTIHSSKNEGQHTDRRYLCYLCNKLFTRRRSVRDHISKIHNTKTWEPVRSLEVIVDPDTGEPAEPLDEIIARGPPPAAAKPEKPQKLDQDVPPETDLNMEEADAVAPIEEPRPLAEVAATTTTANPLVALKKEPSVSGSRASSSEPFTAPAPVIGKKRPAPDSVKPFSVAATKKGMAKVKSGTPNKRPRLVESDSVSETGTPTFRSPSATPMSTQRTPASKLKKQTLITGVASSPSPSSRAASAEARSPSTYNSGTPASSNDDGEIFCICRKGDNHTWMIACDGGCDEWYHGNCVNIRERDGDLIDKYICPTCKRDGYQTTWKRMCRRKGCRKPARVLQDPPSKYCSKECGRMFFVELIRRGDPTIDTAKNGQYVVESGRQKKRRKKAGRGNTTTKPAKAIPTAGGDAADMMNGDSRLATPAYSDDERSEYETDSSADEDQLPNRGGALRAGEVKAILDQCKTVEQWKVLGQKPATPPRELEEDDQTKIGLDEFEKAKLDEVQKQKTTLTMRNEILDIREKFLDLVKARSTTITDEVKKSNPKMKDPCGYDPRFAWSEEEFVHWYEGEGKAILQSGKIGPPEDDVPMRNGQQDAVNGVDESESENDQDKAPRKGGICVRNRCPRHRTWAKGQLAELRFEQDLVQKDLRRAEDEERAIHERGMVKAWEAKTAVVAH